MLVLLFTTLFSSFFSKYDIFILFHWFFLFLCFFILYLVSRLYFFHFFLFFHCRAILIFILFPSLILFLPVIFYSFLSSIIRCFLYLYISLILIYPLFIILSLCSIFFSYTLAIFLFFHIWRFYLHFFQVFSSSFIGSLMFLFHFL